MICSLKKQSPNYRAKLSLVGDGFRGEPAAFLGLHGSFQSRWRNFFSCFELSLYCKEYLLIEPCMHLHPPPSAVSPCRYRAHLQTLPAPKTIQMLQSRDRQCGKGFAQLPCATSRAPFVKFQEILEERANHLQTCAAVPARNPVLPVTPAK